MTRKRLPIGIQTFRTLRERGCYYVDKTPWIERMVDEGTHYFLSRPRRFGKSLFLDTIRELFRGSRSLFAGLHIHDRWDWSVRHPVVRISFGAGRFKAPDQVRRQAELGLEDAERSAGVDVGRGADPQRLARLLGALHRKTGQRVVVLVDEYDKPILDALDIPDIASANRDYLHGFYSVIKDADEHVRFVFLTGVSKFSKVSLFSGLNNLIDITLDPRYGAICGYSEDDLDATFAPELAGLDRDRIRHWYNGYGWTGTERVYNPFDILLLFRHRAFKAHWFETGSPSFLIDTLMRRGVMSVDLEGMVGTDALLSKFDVGDISTEALLFQTGYLTIVETKRIRDQVYYRLGYPNREVQKSVNEHLLNEMGPSAALQASHGGRLEQVLDARDFAGLEAVFRSFLAGIPYEWHTRNRIARYEGYYASLFYSWFAALGFDVAVEESTNRGRLDMAVRLAADTLVFEFKVRRSPGASGDAMAQLMARGYADKYRRPGRAVHLIAVEFDPERRDLAGFELASGG